MNTSPVAALKTLADLAIRGCADGDPLAVYDSIIAVGNAMDASGVDVVISKAAAAARAIRDADKQQLEFRDMLRTEEAV